MLSNVYDNSILILVIIPRDVYGAVIMSKPLQVQLVHLMIADGAPGGRQPSDTSELGL